MKSAAITVGCVVATVVTACSADPGEPLSFYRGKTLHDVAAVISEGFVYAVQDDSVLLGADPGFDEAQWGSTAWTVLAVCADATTLERSSTAELVVVPTDLLDGDDLREITAGRFEDQRPPCDGHTSAPQVSSTS
jgi:hypothetical protein